MKRTVFNAFTRGAGLDRQAGAPTHTHSLASLLAPLRAELSSTETGWRLKLDPMRAVDVFCAWIDLSDDASASVLLYNIKQDFWSDAHGPLSLGAIASRLSLPVIEEFDCNCINLDVLAAGELTSLLETKHLHAILVEGPIESRDARAIVQAAQSNLQPLEVEMRALASFEITSDRTIDLFTRDQNTALCVLGEDFRQYLAALLNRPVDQFSCPMPWQLERMMSINGSITVRPIETEIFSTSVDVGICTKPSIEPGPARYSLIYDLPSHTWHDEP